MIKINLLKAQGVKISKVEGDADSFQEVNDKDLQKQAVIKILFFIAGPIALYMWESQSIGELKVQQTAKFEALSKANSIADKGKVAVQETSKIKEEQGKLQAQINTIEDLRKGRLREVKLLDLIHKQLPSRMWLSEVVYRHTEGSMNLRGVAKSEADITTFMESLQNSALNKAVNLINSSEESLKNETVKKFEILCILDRGGA